MKTKFERAVSKFLNLIKERIDNSYVLFVSGLVQDDVPLFALKVPESFKKEFPSEYSSMKTIANHRIVTPIDLHHSLKVILRKQNRYEKPNVFAVGDSLARTCEEARVSKHYRVVVQKIRKCPKLHFLIT